MPHGVYQFSEFSFERDTQMLSYRGERVSLAPKATQLLLILLDNAPDVVTREALRKQLWSDSTTTEFEGALNACIRQTRAALGDSAGSSTFIETIPKRGYRFVGQLRSGRTRRRHMLWLVAAAAAIVVLAVALYGSPDQAPLRSVVFLPAQGGAGTELDSVTSYGIAMIASERAARRYGDSVEIMNSRTLRQLIRNQWNVSDVGSPDLIVRTLVQQKDDDFLLTVELIDGQSNRTLSALTRNYPADETLLLRGAPDFIASWLGDTLAVAADSKPIRVQQTVDPVYQKALVTAWWHLESGTIEGLRTSRARFDAILGEDPNNVWAMEGKIVASSQLALYEPTKSDSEQALAETEQVARDMQARGIVSDKVHLGLAFVDLVRDWNVASALNQIESALLIAPQEARNHALYATVLAASGRLDDAVQATAIAERLDPASMALRSDRCWFEYLARHFEQARATCIGVLELLPDDPATILTYVRILNATGQPEAALENVRSIMQRYYPAAFNHGASFPTSMQEFGCRRAKDILDNNAVRILTHYRLAEYFALCGDRAGVLQQLQLAIDGRELQALFLPFAPEFDQYSQSQDFQQLLQRLPRDQALTDAPAAAAIPAMSAARSR